MTEEKGLLIDVSIENEVPVVKVHGSLDIDTATGLNQVLEKTIKTTTGCIILDLLHLPYLDSAGLNVIRQTHQKLEEQNRKLYVVVPSHQHPVRRILEISHLDQIVNVRESVEDALREIAFQHRV